MEVMKKIWPRLSKVAARTWLRNTLALLDHFVTASQPVFPVSATRSLDDTLDLLAEMHGLPTSIPLTSMTRKALVDRLNRYTYRSSLLP